MKNSSHHFDKRCEIIGNFYKLRRPLQRKRPIKIELRNRLFFAIVPYWSRCKEYVKCIFACLRQIAFMFKRQRMKDLLLRVRVIVRISNMKISCCHLAEYVEKLYQKACHTCSTITFSHLTNRIIDLLRCCWSRWARSIQPKFPEISVQNSMDRFGPTGKVSKKLVHLLRWSSFPGRTG